MNRASDGTRDYHDYSKDPKVDPPYSIRMFKDRWCLFTVGKKKRDKLVYRCTSASEMGAHREARVYLKTL